MPCSDSSCYDNFPDRSHEINELQREIKVLKEALKHVKSGMNFFEDSLDGYLKNNKPKDRAEFIDWASSILRFLKEDKICQEDFIKYICMITPTEIREKITRDEFFNKIFKHG